MSKTGLTFTADGGNEYLKVLERLDTAATKLDRGYKKLTKSGGKYHEIQELINKSVTSSSRRMNTFIDRLSELEVQLRAVLKRMPKLAKSIQDGFASNTLLKAMRQEGENIANEFLAGFKDAMGIRSPSKVMQKLAEQIGQGFLLGLNRLKLDKEGEKSADDFTGGFKDRIIKGIGGAQSGIYKQFLIAGSRAKDGWEKGLNAAQFVKQGVTTASNYLKGFRDKIVGGFRQLTSPITNAVRATFSAVSRVIADEIRDIEADLHRLSNQFSSVGQSLIGAGMAGLITGGALITGTVGAAAFPINEAMQFEQAMLNSQAILGATNEEMIILNEQVLQMGGDSVAGIDATADAYYSIVSGVQDATQHMAILDSAIATSEAGQANLQATTSGLIAVMNSYAGSGLEAANVSDVFTRTVTMGVGTMDEFVASISPIAGLASELEIGFDEIGTAMAYMTAQGATAGASATRLQSSMVALLRPNTAMTEALRAAGFESGQAAIEQLGLVGALDAVYGALGDDTGAFAEALGSVEALQGSVALLGDGYDEFAERYAEGLDGSTLESQKIQMQGLYATLGQVRSGFNEIIVRIGQHLIPVAQTLGSAILSVIDRVNLWMQENSELAGIIARVAVMGGVLIGGILAIGGAITVVTGAISVLAGGALAGLASAFGAIAAAIFNPVGALIGFVEFGTALATGETLISSVTNRLAGLGLLLQGIGAGLRNIGGGGLTGLQTPAMVRENELLEQRADLLEDLQDAQEKIGEQVNYQVEAGDTLWDLAQEYGVTVQEIRDANDMGSSNLIVSGQELVIPVSMDTEATSREIEALENQIAGIDSEIAGLDTEPFGNLETSVTALWDALGLASDGVMQIISGDVTGGLATLESAFTGVKDAVSDMFVEFSQGLTTFMGSGGDAINFEEADALLESGAEIPPPTVNPFIQAINTMADAVDSGDFSAIEDGIAENIGSIVRGAVSIVGILFGFPVGTTLGLANIVGTAIEYDIGGIGTWLESQGINTDFEQQITDFMNGLWDTLSDSMGAFTGQSQLEMTSTAGVDFILPESDMQSMVAQNPLQPLLDFFVPIADALGSLGVTVAENLPGLGEAISEFFANLSAGEGDTSFINLIRDVIVVIVNLVTMLTGAVLSGLRESLPELGSLINDLMTSISAVFAGDWDTAWVSFVDAIVSLWGVISNFTTGAADGIIEAIENITGVDMPSVEEGFGAWVDAFDMAWQSLEIITDDMMRRFTVFGNQMKLAALDLLFGMIDPIIQATGQNILGEQNYENLQADRLALQADTIGIQASDAITEAIQSQLSEGETIDLDSEIEIAGLTYRLGDVMEWGSVDETSAGSGNRASIQNAIEEAIAAGDTESLEILLPYAVDIGVPGFNVVSEALDESITGGDLESTEIIEQFAGRMGIDITGIVMNYEGTEGYDAIVQALTAEMAEQAGEGDTENLALNVPMAVSFGISDTDVLDAANEAGYEVGDEVTLGLNASLGIESPSQVAIDIGINMMDALVIGMNQQLPMFRIFINKIAIYIGYLVPAMAIAAAQMRPYQNQMTQGFQQIADSAYGLWNWLKSIKIMMKELNLTPDEAIAYSMAGGNPEGRAEGGTVSAGRVYEINEGGIPELGVFGGRTYLFPGQDGYIIPPSTVPASASMGAAGTPMGGGGGIAINYNGAFMVNVTGGEATDPEALRDIIYGAISDYHQEETVSDKTRDLF